MKKTILVVAAMLAILTVPVNATQPIAPLQPPSIEVPIETQQDVINNIVGNKPMMIDLETIRELDKHKLALKGLIAVCTPSETFAAAKANGLLLFLGGGRNSDGLKFSIWLDVDNNIVVSVRHDVGSADQINEECVISVFNPGEWKSEKVE